MFMRFVFCIPAVTMAFVVLVQSNQKESLKYYATCTECMGEVLDLEQELMQNLQKYKEELQSKVKLIRFLTDKLRKYHKEAAHDPELYLSNPLNAFALVRRMYSDWIKWQDYMKQAANKTHLEFIEGVQTRKPISNDLAEACAGIVRIQTTYLLNAKDIAKGIINNKKYGKQLSALDCYALGTYLINQTKHVPALIWLNASLDHYTDYDNEMSDIFGVDRRTIWTDIAMAHYQIGENHATENAFLKALESKPDDENLLKYLDSIQGYIAHDKLCRGEILQKSELFCRYNDTTTPFLKIAPLKMEEVSINPYIVLYHDVIADSEVEELKRVTTPILNRTSVGFGGAHPSRTAQIVNLRSNNTLVVDRINQRLFDMSGLFLTEEMPLQLVNYGIGGHYGNHLDYYTTLPESFRNLGNRIATILIYLNDVEKGGATAFSAINKIIQPKKGTAILWHYLDNAGNGIPKTQHASCPVLVGSKWMALRFIHYYPQLFVKPCYK